MRQTRSDHKDGQHVIGIDRNDPQDVISVRAQFRPDATFVGEPDADPGDIPESVIHEIWRLQKFRTDDLQTVDGNRVVVLDPGRPNDHQGPDFLDARIVVGSTTWAGAVEIHRRSVEWRRHGHHRDPIYGSVVLHVTLVADRSTGELTRADGSTIPEIVLYPHLTESLRQSHWHFRKGGRMFFACQDLWPQVPDAVIAPFLEDLALDRLRRKAARMGERFLTAPDLDQILYEEIFRSLGYSHNGEAMVLLARRIPRSVVACISDPRDTAALLLGTAGLLKDEHKRKIAQLDPSEDLLARHEDQLSSGAPDPLPQSIWRLGKVRPANNPIRRVLQASLLFGPGGPLGHQPLERVAELAVRPDPSVALDEMFELQDDVAAYVAPKLAPISLRLGRDRRVTIAANAILPILTLQQDHLESADDIVRPIDVLRRLPVVMDSVVRRYSTERGRPTSTAVTQGLHELSRSWCGRGRCRDCVIWRQVTTLGRSEQ